MKDVPLQENVEGRMESVISKREETRISEAGDWDCARWCNKEETETDVDLSREQNEDWTCPDRNI